MADPKHPRHFTDEFKRQIASLYNAGKPPSEIMREHDLGSTTLRRWINSINATGSPPPPTTGRPSRTGSSPSWSARTRGAPHGGRRPKTSGADVRTKATVIAANADRYPVSAQCEILGVPRSTYYCLRSRPEPPPAPDPVEPDVLAVHAESKGRYGARKVKASLERRGVVASRRRISRIMRGERPLERAWRKRFKAHPGKPNEAEPAERARPVLRRHAPRASQRPRLRARRRLLVLPPARRPHNREIVGRSAGSSKGAKLVKAAFATLESPISDIEVFRTDRGSGFDNAEIDLMLGDVRHRAVALQGLPLRQRGRRVDEQDPRRSWSRTASPTSATRRPSCPTTCTGTTTSGSTRRSAT